MGKAPVREARGEDRPRANTVHLYLSIQRADEVRIRQHTWGEMEEGLIKSFIGYIRMHLSPSLFSFFIAFSYSSNSFR